LGLLDGSAAADADAAMNSQQNTAIKIRKRRGMIVLSAATARTVDANAIPGQVMPLALFHYSSMIS
jgi:hypothetical protein